MNLEKKIIQDDLKSKQEILNKDSVSKIFEINPKLAEIVKNKS